MKFATLSAAVVGLALASQANAAFYSFTAKMDGPSEAPANASPGIGNGTVTIDTVTHQMVLNCTFSGLTGNTTASHIHGATANPFAGTAGVATQLPSFVGFPLGVTSGTFSNTLDLSLASSWNSSYITANGGTPLTAETAFVNAIFAGKTYWNIHSSTFGGGEIRGFLVPEPTSMSLLGLGAVGLIRRKRKA